MQSIESGRAWLALHGESAVVVPHHDADGLSAGAILAAAAAAAAMRTAPRTGASAALIEINAPARVHAQVAIAWARRLKPLVVVVANRGWRERTISFAVRSAERRDLRAWLRSLYQPPPGSGDYGRGHARATGGSLEPAAYEQFAAAVLA